MRRILIENARRKQRVKHGGGLRRVDLRDHDPQAPSPPEQILALHEALTLLEDEDAVAAQVVKLHFFAGLPLERVAQTVGVSRATAYRQWSYARAWLRCAISGQAPGPATSNLPAKADSNRTATSF
jgi:RNA polymerase sigma factor (TIGR02999 family)